MLPLSVFLCSLWFFLNIMFLSTVEILDFFGCSNRVLGLVTFFRFKLEPLTAQVPQRIWVLPSRLLEVRLLICWVSSWLCDSRRDNLWTKWTSRSAILPRYLTTRPIVLFYFLCVPTSWNQMTKSVYLEHKLFKDQANLIYLLATSFLAAILGPVFRWRLSLRGNVCLRVRDNYHLFLI